MYCFETYFRFSIWSFSHTVSCCSPRTSSKETKINLHLLKREPLHTKLHTTYIEHLINWQHVHVLHFCNKTNPGINDSNTNRQKLSGLSSRLLRYKQSEKAAQSRHPVNFIHRKPAPASPNVGGTSSESLSHWRRRN